MEHECQYCGKPVRACGLAVPSLVETPAGAIPQIIPCGKAVDHSGPCMASCGPSCRCRLEGEIHPIGCGEGPRRVSSAICLACASKLDPETMRLRR